MTHKWARWLHNPYQLVGPQHFTSGDKINVAHERVGWLHNCYHLMGPQRFREEDKIKSGPQVRPVATKPFGVSPMLQIVGQNDKHPISGLSGYIAPTI